MNIHDQLRSIYQLEGLFELLKNNDLQQTKVTEINHLIDEKLNELIKGRNISVQHEKSFESEIDADIEPQLVDSAVNEADEAAIADNAIFEEESAADVSGKNNPYDNADNNSDENIEIDTNNVNHHVKDIEPEIVSNTLAGAVKDEQAGEEIKEHYEHDTDIPANDIAPLDITIDTSDTSYCKQVSSTANLNSSALKLKARNDIKSAFTLNDKFRFCRELFGNSPTQYNDALNMINAMQSFEEAEDYFYNDLGWNCANADVEDFMHIVKTVLG